MARLRDFPILAAALAGFASDQRSSSTAAATAKPVAFRNPPAIDAEVVLGTWLDNAAAVGEPVAAHLWLEDPATTTLRMIDARGRHMPEESPVPTSGTLLGSVLESGGTRLEAVARTTAGHTESLIWRFALPLTVGEARGVAAIDIAALCEPDAQVLNALAAHMRGPLAGALALHVAAIETASAQALFECARDLARLLDPQAVVETMLDRAMEVTGAQTGSVMLLDPDAGKLRIASSRGLPREVAENTEVSEGEGIAGWVLARSQSLVVEDLDGRPTSRRHGVRSAVSVPIADSDGPLGVLNVGSRRYQARFTKATTETLEALARAGASALRNARALQLSQGLYYDTLLALAIALETKDPYARGGTQRVVHVAEILGRAMGLMDREQQALRIAAMLHDIGMSAVGEGVAVSRRPLSTIETGMLRLHPVIAAEILDQAPALQDVVPIVYHHHERYDGSGYALGLAGDQIPIGSRILAVADAYVAMTSDRPYRTAMSHSKAMQELSDGIGTQFDPEVVHVFTELALKPGFSAKAFGDRQA